MGALHGRDHTAWPTHTSHNICIIKEATQLMPKAKVAQWHYKLPKGWRVYNTSFQILAIAQFSSVKCWADEKLVISVQG
jgi:hypothetical protein